VTDSDTTFKVKGQLAGGGGHIVTAYAQLVFSNDFGHTVRV